MASRASRSAKSDTSSTSRAIIPISSSSFSVLRPYLVTCNRGRDATIANDDMRNQNDVGYDPTYIEMPSIHALPENMAELIRQELRPIYFEITAAGLRGEDTYRVWWRRDASMTSMDKRYCVEPRRLYHFLNKEVMVYFETDSVAGTASAKICRYIYRQWLRLNHGRPCFQRDGFFAKAAQISDTDGPQNLKQLHVLHRRICLQLSRRLDDLVDFYPDAKTKTPRPPFYEPVHTKDIQSWRDNGYMMRHLFRALYIVVDNQALVEPPALLPVQPTDDPDVYLEHPQEQSLSVCTVLLVKTGDEAHLHSPISFLPLFDAGLASNVNRTDYQGESSGEETVVRVKLSVAMRFVWELLRREEEALESIGQFAQDLRQEQDTFCDAWVEKVMSHSHRVGVDKNGYSWLAARRALARMNGEAFDEDQVYPFWEKLRRW
ncbi:hypothetical protein F66182_10201 [Fusarium sp. NRRL 66182]|nr:hypothetical protein F66182_10201 [Fusarium sp. NRRL 66182]